ncbi:GSCOCG00002830001-RA-CDS [Cotesia congregata]|nr:GSCOCG00002830001-RA-CDS [Cotesia congregata]
MEVKVIELYNPSNNSRSYFCPTKSCTKSFKYKRSLVEHLKYQCGKPPRFQCIYCDHKNNFKNRIRAHYKLEHPDMEQVRRFGSRVGVCTKRQNCWR